MSLLGLHPKTASLVEGLQSPANERDKDATRKRKVRSENARIIIPDCVDLARREACLADPERFLRVYFNEEFDRPFGRHHKTMIDAIYSTAKHGGRQAVAAPRGCGKSTIAKTMVCYLVLAGMVRFPLPIAATGDFAAEFFSDFQNRIKLNDLLYADFPEVCHPVRELDGAPQRAAKQHVDGQLTRIVWTTNELSLPYVTCANAVCKTYGGVKMTYYGLDAAFRGVNIGGVRPDFVPIDDPETEESASSLGQIEKRAKTLDRAIAGLAEEGDNLAICVFTTIQNRYCLSFQLTDRKERPAFNGLRFGMIVKWPTNMEMWETYISIRHSDQESGDEHGLGAIKYYLDNREAMDAGHEMLTDYYKPAALDDGTPTVYSALQFAFNKIADTNMDAYRAEYQNDPVAEEEAETIGLTAARVQSRVSKYRQREVASTTELRTVGLDLGNYNSHWTDIAWEGNAIGSIVDYGIMETYGLSASSDAKAIELAILASLEVWADDVVSKINPLLVLIDSGSGKGHSEAVYEFCRRRGAPFFPSKGWASNRFRMPAETDDKKPFLETWAHRLAEQNVWLYNVNSEWWKRWTQQRFMTQPFDEAGERTDGSLVLFDPLDDKKRHLSFAHHIVSEEEQLVPVYGKESKRVWFVKNRNNHWLDSTGYACAAAGAVGVRLIDGPRPVVVVEKKLAESKPFTDQYGRPFVAQRK
jgi:energy-coupling factor transporter ATP-binding protein EcfA2